MGHHPGERGLQFAAVPVTLSSFVIELQGRQIGAHCWRLCMHFASLHMIGAQPVVHVMFVHVPGLLEGCLKLLEPCGVLLVLLLLLLLPSCRLATAQ